jgi:hypothetical protein
MNKQNQSIFSYESPLEKYLMRFLGARKLPSHASLLSLPVQGSCYWEFYSSIKFAWLFLPSFENLNFQFYLFVWKTPKHDFFLIRETFFNVFRKRKVKKTIS